VTSAIRVKRAYDLVRRLLCAVWRDANCREFASDPLRVRRTIARESRAKDDLVSPVRVMTQLVGRVLVGMKFCRRPMENRLGLRCLARSSARTLP
jgi:hypothetical protein